MCPGCSGSVGLTWRILLLLLLLLLLCQLLKLPSFYPLPKLAAGMGERVRLETGTLLGHLHYLKKKFCFSSAADLERCSVLTKVSAALCSLPHGRAGSPSHWSLAASCSLPFHLWLCPHQQTILVGKREYVNRDFGEAVLVRSVTGQKMIKVHKCSELSQVQIRSRRARGSVSTGVL